MSRVLFGTDGVRGLAGQYPLDAAGAKSIGMAVGTHFAQPGQAIILAHDPRESSTALRESIVSGLNAVGVNVVLIGVIPTPGLAYLTREGKDFVAGVMITASHNPYQYNGVKVFDSNGDKLSDETEAALNELIEEGVSERGTGTTTNDDELIQDYEDFLVRGAADLKLDGWRLAIDSANGASCGLAERVFTRLGAEVTSLFDKPDGRNINEGCGATDTQALSHEVMANNLNLGIAVDGDADRIMLVDEQGRQLNGDYIMYVVALAGGLKGIVGTVMANVGLENALQAKSIDFVRTKVGDRYVLEGLQQPATNWAGNSPATLYFPNS